MMSDAIKRHVDNVVDMRELRYQLQCGQAEKGLAKEAKSLLFVLVQGHAERSHEQLGRQFRSFLFSRL